MFATRDDVEDLYDIEIDMVCVFDAEITPQLKAVVDATREALVNAAKHSGSKTVDVYCGRENGTVEVFVRDRGRGFDTDVVRGGFGLRNSIQRRIADVGGSTSITSSPDMGTEVEISVVLP
jgi:signal transduction histidine kinase